MPDAELVITSDFTLWGLRSRRADWERHFARMDGVRYAGAVDRPELVQIQRSSRVMAFPCHFEEAFCLAAAECMAAGAVPVTTDDYALSSTVGDAGVLLPGPPAPGRDGARRRAGALRTGGRRRALPRGGAVVTAARCVGARPASSPAPDERRTTCTGCSPSPPSRGSPSRGSR